MLPRRDHGDKTEVKQPKRVGKNGRMKREQTNQRGGGPARRPKGIDADGIPENPLSIVNSPTKCWFLTPGRSDRRCIRGSSRKRAKEEEQEHSQGLEDDGVAESGCRCETAKRWPIEG